MKVVIAGAGQVGRSIALELTNRHHHVTLLDKDPVRIEAADVAEANWILADANELSSLAEAGLDSADVVVAATGDDKSNLVLALLAKSEFGVPRVVGRVNNPKNEWMFDSVWGVDVAVSTPRIMTALVEEAVSVGDVVRILTFRQSETDLVEVTLPEASPLIGELVGAVVWPDDSVLTAIVRDGRPLVAANDQVFEAGDELVFVATSTATDALQTQFNSPDCRAPVRPINPFD
ncbi:MAG: TrkA family potassium uptake protein [Micrococcales bacterium]|nr:TrkA family potassium uptake protein [Micrococcales bacterium]